MEYLIQKDTLESLGDVVREKEGTTQKYSPQEAIAAARAWVLDDGSKEALGNLIANRAAVRELDIPADATKIEQFCFYQCSRMTITSLPDSVTDILDSAFRGCNSIDPPRLPLSLRNIGQAAFMYCYSLTFSEIPATVENIATQAFYNCTGLTSITFLGTPTTIGAAAFQGCVNLNTIRVPWSEGAVANAPWGATNATIIYDYVPGEEE